MNGGRPERPWAVAARSPVAETRQAGYQRSQRRRHWVEEVFCWIKTICGRAKLGYLGWARNQLWMELTAA